jgi:hypothetical protein
MIGYNISQLKAMSGSGATGIIRARLQRAGIVPVQEYTVGTRKYSVFGEDAAQIARKYAELKQERSNKKKNRKPVIVAKADPRVYDKLAIIEAQLQAIHALTSKLANMFVVPAFPEIEDLK